MSKYKVLVLTDHQKHSEENSLYGLVRALLNHSACLSVHVASRGQRENVSFFNNEENAEIYATRAQKDFRFDTAGSVFREGEFVSHMDFQIVLMRMPRPVSDEFLLWVEEVFRHAVIINRPSGIITTSDKSFLTQFQEYCPPLKLCHSIQDIQSFATHQDIVLKPLKAYGGQGILKISGDHLDNGTDIYQTNSYLELQEEVIKSEGFLAMKYLNKVSEGDKRIIVIGGDILAASLRLPKSGSWLCNVAQGGRSESTIITEEEKEIINGISGPLLERGILIFGADTLVGDDGKRVLSEINTLSVGGLVQAEQQTGEPLLTIAVHKIMLYATEQLS